LIEQDSPCPLPPLTFQDASGKDKTLADFRGSVVLLNLWATWCPPCIREMPALNALQQRLGSDDFKVVAISQDRGGAAVAGKWLSSNGFTALPLYLDPTASVGRTLESPGLPVTLLIDRQGRELARLYGPADWDSDDMITKLRQLGGF
jgi:thiol-disulfide isomerase/thioredoxin